MAVVRSSIADERPLVFCATFGVTFIERNSLTKSFEPAEAGGVERVPNAIAPHDAGRGRGEDLGRRPVQDPRTFPPKRPAAVLADRETGGIVIGRATRQPASATLVEADAIAVTNDGGRHDAMLVE